MYYFIMFLCSRHSSKFSWIEKGVEPQIKKKNYQGSKIQSELCWPAFEATHLGNSISSYGSIGSIIPDEYFDEKLAPVQP